MTISKLTVRSFGALVDREFELSPGTNIIEGANESGKTSLASFIKFMLYGLDAKKGSPTEKERFINDKTGRAEGSMEFTHDSHAYRIERSVADVGRETKKLIDLETLTPVRFDGEIGEYLFGVSESVFLNTAFVRQASGSAVDRDEIRHAVSNILTSADETISVSKITKKLDAERVKLRHKNSTGGRLRELEREIASAEAELEASRRDHALALSAKNDLEDKKRMIERLERENESFSLTLTLHGDMQITERREQFKRAHDELEALKSRLDSCEAVDASTRSELAELRARLKSAHAAVSDASDECDALATDITPPSDRGASTESERESIREKAAALSKKLAHGIVLTVVTLPFFIIFIAFGALRSFAPHLLGETVGSIDPFVGYAVGVVGLGMTIRSVIELVRHSSAKKALRELLDSRNVDDVDALYAALDAEERYDADVAKRNNDRILADERLARAEDELRSARDAAATFSDRMRESGLYDGGANGDETLGAIEDAIASRDSERSELERRYNEMRGMVGAMATALRDVDFAAIDARRREHENSPEWDIARTISAEELDKTKLRLRMNTEKLRAIGIQCDELKKAAYSASGRSFAEIGEALAEMKREYESKKLRLEAIELSMELLAECSEQLRRSIIPDIVERASRSLSETTDGKHELVAIGDDFSLRCSGEDGIYPFDLLSSGGADAAYVCLRRALIPALYRTQTPPAIYDESFGAIDEERMLRLVSLIASDDAQSLIFTCRASEADMLRSELSPEVKVIKM